MTVPSRKEIDRKLDAIIEDLEAGIDAHGIVRRYWKAATAEGWLTRFRTACWAFDGGTFDYQLLECLTPHLDHEARRVPVEPVPE